MSNSKGVYEHSDSLGERKQEDGESSESPARMLDGVHPIGQGMGQTAESSIDRGVCHNEDKED